MTDASDIVFASRIGAPPTQGYLSMVDGRTWSISGPVSPETATEQLIERVFTLCTAFRVRRPEDGRELLLFNMSFTPDPSRHQEYGVLAGDAIIESLTITMMNKLSLVKLLHELLDEHEADLVPESIPLHAPDATCRLCR